MSRLIETKLRNQHTKIEKATVTIMKCKATEAVAQRCSVEKMFLEILPQACNFIKKETLERAFSCEFSKISKNTFLYKTPSLAAFEAKRFLPCQSKSKTTVI